jgi:hypothetical protein
MRWALLLLVCLPGLAQAQDRKSALTVSVLERMDNRMDELNQKLVSDLAELRSMQKELISHMRQLDRYVSDLTARVSTLEGSKSVLPSPVALRPTEQRNDHDRVMANIHAELRRQEELLKDLRQPLKGPYRAGIVFVDGVPFCDDPLTQAALRQGLRPWIEKR